MTAKRSAAAAGDASKTSPSSSSSDHSTPKKPKRSTDAAPSAAATTSRRSERKRKPREFADAAGSVAHGGGGKFWSHDDVVALLKATVDFRNRTGSLPKSATMDEFFGSLKGLIDSQLTKKQVGFKLKRLRGKYAHLASAGLPATPSANDQEQVVYDLSKELWFSEGKQEGGVGGEADGDANLVEDGAGTEDEGEEKEEEEEEVKIEEEKKEEDGGAESGEFPFIRGVVAELSKGNGNCLMGVLLEEGLKLVDPEKGKVLEGKLRKQGRAEARLWMKRLKLTKEVAELLVPAQVNDA